MSTTLARILRLTGAGTAAVAAVLWASATPASAAPPMIQDYPAEIAAGGTITITASSGLESGASGVSVTYTRLRADDYPVNFHINQVGLAAPDEVFADSYDTSGIGTPEPGDRYQVGITCFAQGNEGGGVVGTAGPVFIQITTPPTSPSPSPTNPTTSTSPSANPQLPTTGTDIGLVAVIGLVVLAAGVVVIMVVRPRRSPSS